jgi:hypothetical protein
MSRNIKSKARRRGKIHKGKYRPPYTSSHPRPVTITYMNSFEPKEESNV